jgi:hypothetical protein
MKRIARLILPLLAVMISVANTQAGRWLSRDPIEDGAGFVQRDPQPNIYAFVDNNPVIMVDPFGLWKWKGGQRQGQERAIMVAEANDTVGTAANFTHLDPKESKYWLRDANGQGISQNDKIKLCEEYSVPNTVVIGVGELGGIFKLGRNIDALHQVALTAALEKRGFYVEVYRFDTGSAREDIVKAGQGQNVWGLALFGHGYLAIKPWYWPSIDPARSDINGGLAWGGDNTGILVPDRFRSHFKKGLLITFFCHAEIQDWNDLVSTTGNYYGPNGYLVTIFGPLLIGSTGGWEGLVNQAAQ